MPLPGTCPTETEKLMCSHCGKRPAVFKVYGPSVATVCRVCYSFLIHTANVMGFSVEVERVSSDGRATDFDSVGRWFEPSILCAVSM